MAKETKTKDAPVVVDMTTAKTFELLPVDRTYLVSVSAWKINPSKSSEGGTNVHYELTVMEPDEFQGRQAAREDVSLNNEWTLGRIKTLLLNTGYPKEQVEVKRFAIPSEDEMVGRQCTVALRVEKAQEGSSFPDRTRVARFMPKEAYKVASEK